MARTFQMSDGDILFDVNGRMNTIEGFEKVSQDIAEVLLTELDVDRDFGSELPDVEANPTFNISRQQVQTFVMDAIERLRSLQMTNSTTTREEEIASIDSIEVRKNDQTEIVFGLAVTTTAGPALNTGVRLRRSVSLNHILPPGISELDAQIRERFSPSNVTISGETNGT